MSNVRIVMVWECPCDAQERLVADILVPADTPYEMAEMSFRVLWEAFQRERKTHSGDGAQS